MSGTEPHDIVPEGFDLDDARRQWSATDNDDRRHCPNPNCHSMSISARAPDHSSHKGSPGIGVSNAALSSTSRFGTPRPTTGGVVAMTDPHRSFCAVPASDSITEVIN